MLTIAGGILLAIVILAAVFFVVPRVIEGWNTTRRL
jgi:hypothetical protein